MRKQIFEVKSKDSGLKVNAWIKKNHPEITFVFLNKLLRKGGLKVNGRKVEGSHKLEPGDKIEMIEFEKRENSRLPRKLPVSEDLIKILQKAVIYKDENILVINKPAGLAAQGGSKVRESVDQALDHLKFGMEERPKLVHRIDKDTSGIMLLARHSKAASVLTGMFKDREVKKTYWAITAGVPENKRGEINAPLSSKKSNGRIEKTTVDEEGKKAVTFYQVLEKAGRSAAFVELEPITGRMHQLRAHMNYIECPILGDGKYGGSEAFINGMSNKMHLHARMIEIEDLFGKKFKVTADLPPHMQETFAMFGFSRG